MSTITRTVVPAAALVLVLAVNAHASLITPTIQAFSTEITPDIANRLVVNLVNGSGLSGPGLATDTHNQIASGTWLTRGVVFSPNDTAPSVTFNLGSVVNLGVTRIWNNNENEGLDTTFNGARLIDVYTSPDNVTYSFLQQISVAQAGGTAAEPAQDFATAAAGVQYVRFNIRSNWDGDQYFPYSHASNPTDFVGLSEVRFETAAISAVPAPAALPAGLALLALAGLRRRRR